MQLYNHAAFLYLHISPSFNTKLHKGRLKKQLKIEY